MGTLRSTYITFFIRHFLKSVLFFLQRGRGVTERGGMALRTSQHFSALFGPFRIRNLILKISENLRKSLKTSQNPSVRYPSVRYPSVRYPSVRYPSASPRLFKIITFETRKQSNHVLRFRRARREHKKSSEAGNTKKKRKNYKIPHPGLGPERKNTKWSFFGGGEVGA